MPSRGGEARDAARAGAGPAVRSSGARGAAPRWLPPAPAGRVFVLLAAAAWPAAALAEATADSIQYRSTLTTINRVGLTVTNYGFFGNNFNSRTSSFEFPLGSGYEHMARGGLWVGAVAHPDTGDFIGVTTGVVDNEQGQGGQSETEFAPAGTGFLQLSRIQNSSLYSPDAVSDQDFLCSYSDLAPREAVGNQLERHKPLAILVKQRTLAFSLPAADAFVVAQFTIVNLGPTLSNVWVGMYAQLVSGDKNAFRGWPPTSGTGPGWYYKTHLEYDAGRRFYKERYCASAPYPGGCNIAYCPPWAGVKLLATAPIPDTLLTTRFNWWQFRVDEGTRDTDAERYAIMSAGTSPDPSNCVPGLQTCSPIGLVSVGPFPSLGYRDSIRVDFAFVGGEDEARLLEHADYAQFAADIDYRLPEPPPSPRVAVRPGHQRLDLYCDDSPQFATDPSSPAPGGIDFEGYRVYLGLDRQHPTRVGQFDLRDTTGFNTGLDSLRRDPPLVTDSLTYPYHLAVTGLRDGFTYFGAVTSYDQGDPSVPSLESGLSQNKFRAVPNPRAGERPGGVSVYPNPYRVEALWDQGRFVRDHYLWFTNLPPRGTLRIYTLAGDLVFETLFVGDEYRGGSARGLYNPASDTDTPPPNLSGTSFAWNLITSRGQAAATGLYLYSVEGADGAVSRGKFLIVKSDRE